MSAAAAGAAQGAKNSGPAGMSGRRPLGRNSSQRRRQKAVEGLFATALVVCLAISFAALATLLIQILLKGGGRLNLQFLNSYPSRFPQKAGIKAAAVGSLWIMFLTAVISFPVGVGAAVYLEEFARDNRLTRLIETNIANLAGVPSIIYGLLGLAFFVRALHLGRTIWSGALTISLLILPMVIITTREALRAVPNSIRDAAFALGATRWQAVGRQVLPAALPGIFTGNILSLSRAIGESAPLIMIGALTFVAFVPVTPSDPFTVLPIQIFNWVSRPQEGFQVDAAAGIIVLLGVLLSINAVAIVLRNRYQKKW